jgi:hypothetical protein
MVRGIYFERFFGPPKYFALLNGPQAQKVWETLPYSHAFCNQTNNFNIKRVIKSLDIQLATRLSILNWILFKYM